MTFDFGPRSYLLFVLLTQNALTLTGTNFGVSPTVSLVFTGGTYPCAVSSVSATQVVCTVGAGRGTNGNVTINVGGQRATRANQYSYSAPSLQSVNPPNGLTNGGYDLTLVGSSFDTAGNVTVGGFACTPTAPSLYTHTQITCRMAEGQGKDLPITITATSGLSVTVNQQFDFQAPTLSSITPTSDVTGPGTRLLTISGNIVFPFL